MRKLGALDVVAPICVVGGLNYLGHPNLMMRQLVKLIKHAFLLELICHENMRCLERIVHEAI